MPLTAKTAHRKDTSHGIPAMEHRHDLPHTYHDRRTRHQAAQDARTAKRVKLKATLGAWALTAMELIGMVLVMCSLTVLIITGGPELAAWIGGLVP